MDFGKKIVRRPIFYSCKKHIGIIILPLQPVWRQPLCSVVATMIQRRTAVERPSNRCNLSHLSHFSIENIGYLKPVCQYIRPTWRYSYIRQTPSGESQWYFTPAQEWTCPDSRIVKLIEAALRFCWFCYAAPSKYRPLYALHFTRLFVHQSVPFGLKERRRRPIGICRNSKLSENISRVTVRRPTATDSAVEAEWS